MKGLIIKDIYMAEKYCRSYLIISVVFISLPFIGKDNLFFAFYPCFLAGMIPTTLLGYDERSKWDKYAGVLPYTRAQIVSGKYIVGLMAQITIFVLTASAWAVRMNLHGTFDLNEYLAILSVLFILSCVPSGVSLPFMFKFGVEKGRVTYYITIGLLCAGSAAATALFSSSETMRLTFNSIYIILCVVFAALYALSWYMSVVFYKRREF